MREDPPAATLYFNGEVVTLESGQPHAAAIAIAGDRILAVGSTANCRAALEQRRVPYAQIDLGGDTMLPGFIDTHLHPIALLYFDLNADLRGVPDIASLQGLLREAASHVTAGEWLVGLQLDPQLLAERRLPTRHELDAIGAAVPVVVLGHDGHSAAGSTAALAAAGIDANTPDPSGGRVERAPNGELTGACFESAAQLLLGAIPSPALDRLRETARSSFRRLAAHGITSVGVVLQTDDEGPAGTAGRLEALALQFILDEVPFASYAILVGRNVEAAVALRESPLHEPSAGRRVGGFKIFADGTLGSCTACMRQAFADRPGERGFLTLDEDEILARMRAAHAAELQICVHAIGDAAMERCVTLYERLLSESPRPNHRHRIEHASVVPPELIPRIAQLGLCISTQPLFIHSEKTWLHRRLGAERARQVYPLRALVDAGIIVGGASDAPVESTDVLHAIQCCITREGFETQQALTPAQALHLFTRDAAYLQFEEHEKGTLAPGKRADLVVLSANPLRVAPQDIAAIRVQRTVSGGRLIYDHEGESPKHEGSKTRKRGGS